MTILFAGEGRSFPVGADKLTVKGERDAFSFIEYEAAAQAPGPPLYVHRDNEEAFYVLDGEVRFTLDGRTEVRKSGGSCSCRAAQPTRSSTPKRARPGGPLTTR